ILGIGAGLVSESSANLPSLLLLPDVEPAVLVEPSVQIRARLREGLLDELPSWIESEVRTEVPAEAAAVVNRVVAEEEAEHDDVGFETARDVPPHEQALRRAVPADAEVEDFPCRPASSVAEHRLEPRHHGVRLVDPDRCYERVAEDDDPPHVRRLLLVAVRTAETQPVEAEEHRAASLCDVLAARKAGQVAMSEIRVLDEEQPRLGVEEAGDHFERPERDAHTRDDEHHR